MTPIKSLGLLALCLLLDCPTSFGASAQSALHKLSAISFVGPNGSSSIPEVQLSGVVFDNAAGAASSTNYTLIAGFWPAVDEGTNLVAGIALFNFSDMEDQEVYHGGQMQFYITTTNTAGVTGFTLQNKGSTNVQHASVELVPVSDRVTLVRYTPQATDLFEFDVDIAATNALGQVVEESSITITPLPILPAEMSVIQSVLALPNDDSSDFIGRSQEISPTEESFNGRLVKTRHVTIVGKTVVIAAGHENRIYESYGGTNGVQDIKTMDIFAERIEVQSSLRMQGAQVNLFGKEVVYQNDATFLESEQIAEQTGLTWLSPPALRMVMAHARATYLANGFQEARTIIAEYTDTLDQLTNSVAWGIYTADEQSEFIQMRNEMSTLLWTLDRNLDYYGNPAGWVPNLSLESSYAFFSSEVQESIRILYLTYWLNNVASNLQSRINGMDATRSRLYAENKELTTEIETLQNRLPELQSKAEFVASEIASLQARLDAREKELRQQYAAAQSKPAKKKKNRWRTIAGTVGSIMKVLPVGQPITGAIGTGLQLASTVNRSTFSSIGNIVNFAGQVHNIASQFTAANFQTAFSRTNFEAVFSRANIDAAFDRLGTYVTNKLSTLDPSKLFPPVLPGDTHFMTYVTNVTNYIYNFQHLRRDIRTNVDNLQQTAKQFEADVREMLGTIQDAKAQNPELNIPITTTDGRQSALLDELALKITDKKNLADEITEAVKKIGGSTDTFHENIVALDSINRDLANANGALAGRTVAHLKEIENRAKARLEKYWYYLAKSYEYRFLDPLNESLDLSTFSTKSWPWLKPIPTGMELSRKQALMPCLRFTRQNSPT